MSASNVRPDQPGPQEAPTPGSGKAPQVCPPLRLAEPACRLWGQDMSVRAGGRLILADVTMSLEPGELVGVIGPNGAGKSTLLGALSGDVPLSGGQVRLDQEPVAQMPVRERARKRAVLPQHHEVGFAYLVSDVVLMGRTPWRQDAQEDREVVAWALSQVDASHLADREVPTLSGGELARVHLARVLAQGTGVVLLDEPTAALDVAHQETVLSVAHQLSRLPAPHTRAVMAVLHDLSLAAAWCDRLVLMRKGQIVADGTPWQVCDAEMLSEVYGWPLRVVEDADSGVPVITPVRQRHSGGA